MGAQTPFRELEMPLSGGLVRLTYLAGAGALHLRPAEGDETALSLQASEGRDPGRLERPGDSVLVRAARPGRLVAQWRGLGPAPRLMAEPVAEVPAFRLLAHIGRLGDREAMPGQWIAGPKAPAPIEGLTLRDWAIADLAAEIEVRLATRPPRWLGAAAPGEFAGTRGASTPLCGLRLRLTGAAAADWRFKAEALFLGAAILARRGESLELVGPAPRDPLVGLRLALERPLGAARA